MGLFCAFESADEIFIYFLDLGVVVGDLNEMSYLIVSGNKEGRQR